MMQMYKKPQDTIMMLHYFKTVMAAILTDLAFAINICYSFYTLAAVKKKCHYSFTLIVKKPINILNLNLFVLVTFKLKWERKLDLNK